MRLCSWCRFVPDEGVAAALARALSAIVAHLAGGGLTWVKYAATRTRPAGVPPCCSQVPAAAADKAPRTQRARADASIAPDWRAISRPWLNITTVGMERML